MMEMDTAWRGVGSQCRKSALGKRTQELGEMPLDHPSHRIKVGTVGGAESTAKADLERSAESGRLAPKLKPFQHAITLPTEHAHPFQCVGLSQHITEHLHSGWASKVALGI